MDDIRIEIIEQLRQLQVLMHRVSFHSVKLCSSFRGRGRVLSILKEQPEISRRELGQRLNISKQSLAELLSKLEKAGHIIREPSPEDRRAMIIRLTPAGLAAAQEADVSATSLPGLLDCLEPEELALLKDCLNRILTSSHRRYHSAAPGSEEVRQAACAKGGCPGPEQCSFDYLKYGHDRPNPAYCKYARQAGQAGSAPLEVTKDDP